MKKAAVLFINILLLLALASCSSPREDEKLSVTGIYFDTVIQIDAWGVSTSVLEECKEICENYETLFSNKISASEVSLINASAGNPVHVSRETIDLISLGLKYCELSGGKFDITIAPLSDLWNFTDNPEHKLPDDSAIKEACSHVDYRKVLVDKNACTVTLQDPQAKIDLGGIAKGYIADRLKEYLKEEGVDHALINLGGNVLTLGTSYDGSPFRIGIQKPFDEQNTPIDIVEVQDRSVVSSGVYQRFFEKDGRLYHHILNPKTGYPYADSLLQATVITDSSADGDALSTCCFALGLKEGGALIERLEDVQAIFVTEDYSLHYVGY